MKHCLFVQWKKPTDASRFVIDGKYSEYSGTDIQDKIMMILSDIQNNKEICSNKGNPKLSPSFRCSYRRSPKNASLYIIEGNFEETDIAGRKLVYIFATYESDSQKWADILKEYASILGVTLNKEDIKEINQISISHRVLHTKAIITNNKNSKSCIITIMIAIIFLLLFMWLNRQKIGIKLHFDNF